MDFSLVDQADQCQALIDLSQVEDYVVLAVGGRQFNNTAWLLVKLSAAFLIDPINAGYVDHDLNQLAAYLIMLHVHWIWVSADVNLAYYVEQESLLDLRTTYKRVQHRRDVSHLGQKLLDDFW